MLTNEHVYLIRREEKGFEVGGWSVRLEQIQSVSTTEARQEAYGAEAKMADLHIVYLDDSFLDKVKNVFGVSSREDGEPEEKSILMNSRVDAENMSDWITAAIRKKTFPQILE